MRRFVLAGARRRLAEIVTDTRGQATVEVVALLPLIATFGLAIGHVLAAEATREMAGHAAEAAAIAVGRGGDARTAARASLPEWSRERIDVVVRGREVRVRVEPPAVAAALGDALATTVTADAGPAPEGEPASGHVEDDRTSMTGRSAAVHGRSATGHGGEGR
jgi:hypothetical protein